MSHKHDYHPTNSDNGQNKFDSDNSEGQNVKAIRIKLILIATMFSTLSQVIGVGQTLAFNRVVMVIALFVSILIVIVGKTKEGEKKYGNDADLLKSNKVIKICSFAFYILFLIIIMNMVYFFIGWVIK